MKIGISSLSEQDKELSKLTKEEWREYTKSIWYIANVTHEIHPAMFPLELSLRLIKMFSFRSEIVLDPFCGIGTTGIAALSNGRRFIGIDINSEYIAIAKKKISELKEKASCTIVEGNSAHMDFLVDSSIDLIVSSPPYWNKADYGNSNENLGSITSYKKFLDSIKIIFDECYRVLRPGRRMCIVTANVHQNTKDGLLTFPLSTDYVNICRNIGFRLVNEIIWVKDGTGGKWGSYGSQRPIFGSYPYPPNFLFKNLHEYILILKKPPSLGNIKSNNIPSYDELMK
jgi:site-specific DNA-methyltransferase (adenine-specific)